MTAGEVLIERGRVEGELRGMRATLLKQLTLRFKTLPDWVATRLEGADTAQLERWSERILTAASVEEALG
jgi:hypothetical protein